jgi:hypothetical protein
MSTKKPNAEQVWKQLEDLLVPRLRLSTTDRVVYSHLLRHSRLEGELRLQFSILWLARGAGICHSAARWAVRRLIAHGVLRLVERSKAGHLVEVRLPGEVRAARPRPIGRRPLSRTRAIDFDDLDWLKHPTLRRAIHAREGGRCFYCLSRLTPATRCLDHVVPLGKVWGQFLAQPGFLLPRVQLQEKRSPRGRFSPVAPSRAPPDRRRAGGALPRFGCRRRR